MRPWSFFSVIINLYLSNFPLCIIENVLNLSFTSLNWFSAVSNLLFRWWFLINQLCFLSIHTSLISLCFSLFLLPWLSGVHVPFNTAGRSHQQFPTAPVSSLSPHDPAVVSVPLRQPLPCPPAPHQLKELLHIGSSLRPFSRRLALPATSPRSHPQARTISGDVCQGFLHLLPRQAALKRGEGWGTGFLDPFSHV